MELRQIEFKEYWQQCITCGVWFGMDANMDANRRQDKRGFYCPNGHSQVYSESDADRLRKELEAEKQRTAMERSTRIAIEQTLMKERKAHTRQSKRIHAGVCPCCNRTFQNLARHMQTKHKDVPAL